MHKKPEISLIICTHNRADTLNESLIYYSKIKTEITFEILVVVNQCNDHTIEVIERHLEVLPNIRYVREQTLGTSYARNCGWKNALGPIAFYIDDDAYPSENVIDVIYKLTRESTIISFTGRTIYWRANDPRWIQAKYVEMPKISDKIVPMYKKGHLNGCACGFRILALEKVGGFRLDLDMKGKKLGYGVEEEMRLKLLAINIPTYYIPHLTVQHKSHNKTVLQFFNSAYNKGKYFAKVRSKNQGKLLVLFTFSFLKAVPIFIFKILKKPYQNALVESFSLPLNYLGQLLN